MVKLRNDKKVKGMCNGLIWKELHDLCDGIEINISCMYNTNKIGLFYYKFPNALYVENHFNNDYK